MVVSRENEISLYLKGRNFTDAANFFQCTKKQIEEIFFKSKKWNELSKRLTFICRKYNKFQFSEDIINSYALHLLEEKGNNQTLEQFFMDYSKKVRWYVRGKDIEEKKELTKAAPLHLCKPNAFYEQGINPNLYFDIKRIKLRYALVIKLKIYGFFLTEIGEVLGIAPSNVSTMLKNIKENNKCIYKRGKYENTKNFNS